MQCSYCGMENTDDSVLCAHCGFRLERRLTSPQFWPKLALAILIPALIYILMTRVLLPLL